MNNRHGFRHLKSAWLCTVLRKWGLRDFLRAPPVNSHNSTLISSWIHVSKFAHSIITTAFLRTNHTRSYYFGQKIVWWQTFCLQVHKQQKHIKILSPADSIVCFTQPYSHSANIKSWCLIFYLLKVSSSLVTDSRMDYWDQKIMIIFWAGCLWFFLHMENFMVSCTHLMKASKKEV